MIQLVGIIAADLIEITSISLIWAMAMIQSNPN